MKKTHCLVIEHDSDPDFSWLEQDHYNPRHPSYEPTYYTKEDMKARRNPIDADWYRDPDNHVALATIAYDEDGNILDSLGGIDFLADSDEWKTGTFYKVSQLPEGYLKDIAREMELRE
jgi:hypothetical protein